MGLRSLCSRDSVIYKPRAAAVGAAGSRAFLHAGSTTLACQIQPQTGADIVTVQQREYVVTHAVYFADDPGSSHGDRFVVAAPAHLAGKVLEQVGPAVDRSAGLGRLWRADCEEKERDQ